MDAWLEVSACNDASGAVTLEPAIVRQVPALSESLAAAHDASSGTKRHGMWDYARRLGVQELEQIKAVVNFVDRSEDSRSIALSARVLYCDTCYSLRLFFEKSQ